METLHVYKKQWLDDGGRIITFFDCKRVPRKVKKAINNKLSISNAKLVITDKISYSLPNPDNSEKVDSLLRDRLPTDKKRKNSLSKYSKIK